MSTPTSLVDGMRLRLAAAALAALAALAGLAALAATPLAAAAVARPPSPPLLALVDRIGRNNAASFVHLRAAFAPFDLPWGLHTVLAALPPAVTVKSAPNSRFFKGCCPVASMSRPALFAALAAATAAATATPNATTTPGAPAVFAASYLRTTAFAADTGVYFADAPNETRGHQWWTGSAGATTALHYDPVDNVYVQLNGAKTFILVADPPWAAMAVFPRHAMRHRSAAVGAAGVAPARTTRVVLHPGDVLYLPPGTFHEVVAGTHWSGPSISLNFWGEPPLVRALDAVWEATGSPFRLPRPPLHPRPPLAVVAHVVARVVDALDAHVVYEPAASLRAAIASMYVAAEADDIYTGPNIDVDAHAKLMAASRPALPPPRCRAFVAGIAPRPWVDARVVDAVVASFRAVAATTAVYREQALVAMYVGHWVDDVVASVYGPDACRELVPCLLRHT